MSSDVLARKLQGVYDCIDARNYKGAVKLCQKKDIQHYDVTKALMAYSLISMQRTEEGLAIAREIKDRSPADDSLLKTLGHCFRLAQMDTEVAECYENALAQRPASEELAVELFKAYARCGDAKKMQAGALKLYKAHNNPKYVFWAVCSMLQQEGAPGTVLMLAERMLRRVLFETQTLSPPKRTAGAEEALLWVDVLTRQAELAATPEDRIAKLKEALQSLQDFGSLSEKVKGAVPALTMHSPVEQDYRIDSDVQFKADPSIVELHPFMGRMRQVRVVQQILATCFPEGEAVPGPDGAKHGTRAEYQAQLIALLDGILMNYPDQWDAHEMWIAVAAGEGAAAVLAHRERLSGMQTNYPQLRGPYLAEIQLLVSARAAAVDLAGWPPSAVTADTEGLSALPAQPFFFAEMSRLLCRYICMFGSKDCCFNDIKKYIDCAFKSEGADSACRGVVEEWLQGRRAVAGSGAWKGVPSRPALSSLNKLDQILHYISPAHTTRSLLADRLGLHSLACSADVAVAGAGLEDRGLRAGDNLLLVCSAWLQDALGAMESADSGAVPPEIKHFFGHMLWATVLKAGRLCSEHNYTFPLQSLLGPARSLALSDAALKAYTALDVKQIQIDSMTYLAVPPLIEAGYFREALSAMRAVIAFHKSARQETGEMLCKACKMSNYDKALEIKNFGTRCARSMQLGLAQSEFPLLDIADSKHTRADAVAYLKLYRAGFLAESATNAIQMSREESDKYYFENMDYDVLPPSCAHEAQRAKQEEADGSRRAGYLRRLDVSRSVSSLMLKLMQLDPASEILPSIEALRRAAAAPAVTGRPSGGLFGPFSLSAYSCGPDGFEQTLWGAVCDVAAFSAESLRLATETDVVSERAGVVSADGADTGRVLLELRAAAVGSLRAAAAALGAAAALPTAPGAGGAAPLSPTWTRMASAFCLTVGSLCPLMLETLAEPLVHTGTKAHLKPLVTVTAAAKAKKKGPKKAAAEAAVAVPEGAIKIDYVISEVADELSSAMSIVLESLHNAKRDLNEESLKHFTSSWAAACSSDAELQTSVCDVNIFFQESVALPEASGSGVQAGLNALLVRARAAVLTDVASSQLASCVRLHETLEKKANHFKTIFPDKPKV